MRGLEFIKSKQQSWAQRNNFELIGGTKNNKGETNYLHSLANNLFEQLTPQNLTYYNSGDGHETRDSKTRLAKMKAIHSSSAIVVNLFQYWQGKNIYPIMRACNLCAKDSSYLVQEKSNQSISQTPFDYKIKFEEQFEISEDKDLFPYTPNIDVIIENFRPKVFAIESKFTEPYCKRHGGLKTKYVENDSFWNNIPHLYQLAKEISPDDNKYQYLDAAQLLKHILGLKKNCKNFHLLYLWYDVIGTEGAEHRKEIEECAEIAQKDNIKFSHTTYQEIIIKLSKEFYTGNERYCDYLTERYL